MDLKKLQKIDIKDLKSVDWFEVKDQLLRRPDLIIIISLIVVTFIFVTSTYRKYKETTKSLRVEIMGLDEKLEILNQYENTQKQYDNFIKSAPDTISADLLIGKLSDYASIRNVQILSFSPAKEESNNFLRLTSIEVNVASESYANIILFMHDIETSPFSLRVGKWAGSYVIPDGSFRSYLERSDSQDTDVVIEKEYIKATIRIELVELKNV